MGGVGNPKCRAYAVEEVERLLKSGRVGVKGRKGGYPDRCDEMGRAIVGEQDRKGDVQSVL